jgi:hypothetical protein
MAAGAQLSSQERDLVCPITHELFTDPVILCDGARGSLAANTVARLGDMSDSLTQSDRNISYIVYIIKMLKLIQDSEFKEVEVFPE